MTCQFYNCIIVVDVRKLEDWEKITCDFWSWKNGKSYVVSSNENRAFKNCNDKKQYREVKRYYKCCTPRYKPNIQATGRNKNNFKEAEDLVIVQYEFSNKAKDIPPSEKSRTYQSIKR